MTNAPSIFSTEPLSDGLLVKATKDINLKTSPVAKARLMEYAKQDHVRLVLDLGDVAFMDSSGVATLVEVLREQKNRGHALVVCCLQPRVLSMFKISRLDTLFNIVDDVETAKTV